MSEDPKIAGMGMPDLVEEVQRVREQRDEARAETERLRESKRETFRVAVDWQDTANRYREALERAVENGPHASAWNGRQYDTCPRNFGAHLECRCWKRDARAALDGDDR